MGAQSSYDIMATMPTPPPRVFVAPPLHPTAIPLIVEALRSITPLNGDRKSVV